VIFAVVVAGALPAPAFAGSPKPYVCNARQVGVEFAPQGYEAHGGFEETTRPTVLVFNGFRRSLGTLIAEADVNAVTSGISYGPLCAPKPSLGALVSRANTRTSAPSWLRCSFPRSLSSRLRACRTTISACDSS
jgi:hypothetical protein